MILLNILKAEAPNVAKIPARRSPPKQGDYDRMAGRRQAELRKLIERLKGGDLSVDEFGDLFDTVLLEGHSAAWTLGRQLAGKLEGETLDDVLQGIAHKDPEAQYLLNFINDIAAGRYTGEDGEYNANAIYQRGALYIGKMRGTANEAFVQESTDQEFYWVLGLNEKHCDDCPRIADLSPFTKDTLFAYPGSGDTECLGNCKCHLRREDGVRGFLR